MKKNVLVSISSASICKCDDLFKHFISRSVVKMLHKSPTSSFSVIDYPISKPTKIHTFSFIILIIIGHCPLLLTFAFRVSREAAINLGSKHLNSICMAAEFGFPCVLHIKMSIISYITLEMFPSSILSNNKKLKFKKLI